MLVLLQWRITSSSSSSFSASNPFYPLDGVVSLRAASQNTVIGCQLLLQGGDGREGEHAEGCQMESKKVKMCECLVHTVCRLATVSDWVCDALFFPLRLPGFLSGASCLIWPGGVCHWHPGRSTAPPQGCIRLSSADRADGFVIKKEIACLALALRRVSSPLQNNILWSFYSFFVKRAVRELTGKLDGHHVTFR